MYLKLDRRFYDYQMVEIDDHIAIGFTEAASVKDIRLADGLLENITSSACFSCSYYLSNYILNRDTDRVLDVFKEFIKEDISNLKETVATDPILKIKLYEALVKCPGFAWAKEKGVELECLKKIKIEKVRDIDFPKLKWYICPFKEAAYLRKDEYHSLLFPNVSCDGEICWGSVSLLDKMLHSKTIDLNHLVNSFWKSNFNFDYIGELSPAIYIDEFGADYSDYYEDYSDYTYNRDPKNRLDFLELYQVLPLLPNIDNDNNESFLDINNERPIQEDTIGIYIDTNSGLIYEIKAEDDKFYYGHTHQYEDYAEDGEDDKLVFVKIKKP
jgi:hypothetical protein